MEKLIKEIIENEAIENKIINLNTKNVSPIFFECRSIAMKRCITNLLNNACSYGNNINVSLDKKKDIISRIPINRLGTTEDLYKTLNFIIETNYLNGSTIKLDGGFL